MANKVSLKNLCGQRFGAWQVRRRWTNDDNGHTRWLCECDCGTWRPVLAANLQSTQTTSCGCVQRAKLSIVNRDRYLRSRHEYIKTYYEKYGSMPLDQEEYAAAYAMLDSDD